jgi:hypothetical protein
MQEIKDLHKPFKEFLKKNNILYIYTNWNNHNRQGDEGHPDFIIPVKDSKTLYIEFKTKEKYFSTFFGLSGNQRKWQKYLFDNKHLYLLTYNLDEAKISVVAYISEVKDEKINS